MWEKYELLVDFGQRFLTFRPVSILPFPVIGVITLSFTSVLLQPWEVFLIFLHVNRKRGREMARTTGFESLSL